jgi:hypothetical protein
MEEIPIDVITTGRRDLLKIAEKYGFLIGANYELAKTYDDATRLNFLDAKFWENPDVDDYVRLCHKVKPKYAVAGDYDRNNIDEINERAERIRQSVENVIIVPHASGEVEEVPEWAVVGYSVDSDYNSTDAPIYEYQGRDVHILGGTPDKQIELLTGYFGKAAVSIDGNSIFKSAVQYVQTWVKTKPRWRHSPPHITENKPKYAYESSLNHVSYSLREALG